MAQDRRQHQEDPGQDKSGGDQSSEDRIGEDERGDDLGDDLAALCRAAVARFKADAFDNVTLGSMLSDPEIRDDDARWIGRHLMSHGRSRDAYVAGQAILRRLPVSGTDRVRSPSQDQNQNQDQDRNDDRAR